MNGPTGSGPDDQFGGPSPDNAHFSGVILRLNDDGRAPTDNPFFDIGRAIGGEVGQNVERVFAYGIRNSFGMTFDPLSGRSGSRKTAKMRLTRSTASSAA